MLPTPKTAALLKTPTVMDGVITTGKKNPVSGNSGTLAQEIASGFVYRRGILPTPEANNYKNGHRTLSPRIERKLELGWAVGLNDRATLGLLPTPLASQATHGGPNQRDSSGRPGLQMAAMAMLPTPTTSSRNGGTAKEREDGVSRRSELNHLVAQECGTTSQLSPLFVEEMMGFPRYWILLPFLKESPAPREPSLSTVGAPNP
jgi:DNA (cytosine-5)-methyltransferase 1